VDFVDVRSVFGDVAGHFTASECDKDFLAGLESEAGSGLEARTDKIHFRVLAKLGLLATSVRLATDWFHHRSNGVLRNGHALALGRIHFRSLDRLNHAYTFN